MAPPNLEATAIVLDIGLNSHDRHNGARFFTQAMSCISRIIDRKIFSRPSDLLSLIVMGSEETQNKLAMLGGSYENISIAIGLNPPSWDMIETLQNKVKPTQIRANWVDALLVAADYLQHELKDKKVSAKKIVLLTDFKAESQSNSYNTQKIIENLKTGDIEPIIIGHEIDNIKCDNNKRFIELLLEECDGIICSFDEANLQLLYHKKKSSRPSPWYADLCIGPSVKVPVSGFPRIRDNNSVIKQWNKIFQPTENKKDISYPTSSSVGQLEPQNIKYSAEAVVPIKTFSKKDDSSVSVSQENLLNGYLYGQTIVPYSKIDQSMEYKSGEKGLILYGFTKADSINWGDLSGDGVTFVVPKNGCDNAKQAIDALVTVLHREKFVAIARKVQFKNAPVKMVALFPIIEEEYKCLSMVHLAFKEDYRHVVFPKLDQKKYLPNDEQLKAMDNLINAMDLKDTDENGKNIFSLDSMVNAKVQHILDSISYRALHPEAPLPPPRPEIEKLLEVPEVIAKLSKEPLDKIKEYFPLVLIEKTKSGKHWVDGHFSNGDQKMKIEDLSPSAEPTPVTSVLNTNITKVGTVRPAEDFMELVKSGKALVPLCNQLTDIIENLVICAFGDDFSKPIYAMKIMREECLQKNPTFYNEWLLKFKVVLLDKFKTTFLCNILESKLGLITNIESPLSSVLENDAEAFGNIEVNESISNAVTVDTTDLDDAFADDIC